MVAMRSPIPAAIREELSQDPFMSRCILEPLFCSGRIQWHHWSYAGKRVNELFSIVPLCEEHHRKEAQYRDAIDAAVRNRVVHFHAEEDFRRKFPKSTLLSP
jgi:hypothetical protein